MLCAPKSFQKSSSSVSSAGTPSRALLLHCVFALLRMAARVSSSLLCAYCSVSMESMFRKRIADDLSAYSTAWWGAMRSLTAPSVTSMTLSAATAAVDTLAHQLSAIQRVLAVVHTRSVMASCKRHFICLEAVFQFQDAGNPSFVHAHVAVARVFSTCLFFRLVVQHRVYYSRGFLELQSALCSCCACLSGGWRHFRCLDLEQDARAKTRRSRAVARLCSHARARERQRW